MPTRTREQTSFGANLMSLRQERQLTQRQLAAKAGVSLGIIQKLEEGWSDNPRLSTLRRLAEALNVPIGELAGECAAPTVTRPFSELDS